jgi:hypothetical protein
MCNFPDSAIEVSTSGNNTRFSAPGSGAEVGATVLLQGSVLLVELHELVYLVEVQSSVFLVVLQGSVLYQYYKVQCAW